MPAALSDMQEREEFVDYYTLLQVPREADARTIHRRVFDLYEEAARNLDHRNHRKRFYYTTLYETHLARARHFLLEPARRVRYDEFVKAFHAGQAVDFPTLVEQTAGIKDSAQPALQPTQPANAPTADSPVQTPAPPRAATAAPPLAVPTQADPVQASPVQKPAPATFTAREELERVAEIARAASTFHFDPHSAEKRRDNRRRELIAAELKAQGQLYFLVAAGLVTALGSVALWRLQKALVSPPDDSISAAVFVLLGLGFLLTCGAAWLCGWQASRWARRRIIGTLSKMHYDDLLRLYAPKFKAVARQ